MQDEVATAHGTLWAGRHPLPLFCLLSPIRCFFAREQGDSFSTAGVSEANAIAKAGGASGMSALNAKSATHTMPYTYPGTTALTKVGHVHA